MARAAALRLRAALAEYVAENKGDHPRAHARGDNAELVKQAEALLGGLGPAEGTAGDTPGARASGRSPGRSFESAADRARELLAPHQGAPTAGSATGADQ